MTIVVKPRPGTRNEHRLWSSEQVLSTFKKTFICKCQRSSSHKMFDWFSSKLIGKIISFYHSLEKLVGKMNSYLSMYWGDSLKTFVSGAPRRFWKIYLFFLQYSGASFYERCKPFCSFSANLTLSWLLRKWVTAVIC